MSILKQRFMIFDYPKSISDINVLPDLERQQLLYEFTNTYVNYPREKTINQLFEAGAKDTR